MIQSKARIHTGRTATAFCAVILAVFMAGTAYAAMGLVKDRRVSMAQAVAMAKKAQNQKSEFPIVVNDMVLKQLNRYIGTPEGRDFMKTALQRMENYRGLVTAKIQEYGLPMELMAMPITESGYQNLAERNRKGRGVGLWMFIKSTARAYGLRVDMEVDERMNETVETDAAMRYLQSNHLRFKDWPLAVLAYNIGESSVQQAIEATGSRDAWTLIRNGYENDRDYLPKIMAAILVMRNPESVQ